MTAPLTPEEREKTLAFIRETLAQEPDAPPLRSLRFLLAELDQVKAERDEDQDAMNGRVSALLSESKKGWATAERFRTERDAALAALAEATAPLGNQAQNFARVVGERNAALAELKKVKAERDNYRLNHDALGKSYDHAIEDKDAALAEAKALREAFEAAKEEAEDMSAELAEREPKLTADDVQGLHEEGTELRKEIERRVAPMKQGPFEPPEGT